MDLARLIIGSLLAMVGLAIDIATFFVLVRGLLRWYPSQLLVALDHAGTPLVELVLDHTAALATRLNLQGKRRGPWRPRFSSTRGQRLALALVGLLILRLTVGLVQAVVR